MDAFFPGWSWRRKAVLASICGALAALGQAPLGWWWITLPALAVLLRLIASAQSLRTAFGIGWAAGSGYFALALAWIVEPFLIDIARHGWMAPFAVLLLAGGLGLFWGAAATVGRRAAHPVLGAAIALGLAEMLRGIVLTGFPWAMLGHVWIDTPVAQLAAYVGPNGLTLLTCLVAAGLAHLRRVSVTPAALALALTWGGGVWRLSLPLPADRDVTVRLIQPNAEQSAKWDADQARILFDRQLAYTAAKPAPDLSIWPETAVPYTIESSPEIAGVIAKAGGGHPVAVGIQRTVEDGAEFRGWNSLRVISPDGAIFATYDKHHLVPFGEYIPLGDLAYRWFGLTAFAAQTGQGYSAGIGPVVLNLGPKLGKVLPLICYEAIFADLANAVPERADWMLQITNDAWFGTWSGPFQHVAQARLRAIEQGLPLVRVANTGVTGVYDARGQVTAALAFGTAAYLDAAVPGAMPPTVFARFGEWPALALYLCAAGLAFIRRWRSVA
jgi:apolipoprotein N-acyltransferase